MRLRSLCFIALLLLSRPAYNQEKYGELIVSAPLELADAISEETRAVLHIVSEVPDLQFESTLQIFERRHRGINEWELHVEPGRQQLIIRAGGYLPAGTEMIFLQAKRAYRLQVSPLKPIPGALSIKTKPDSARVFIDGVLSRAKTPALFDEVLPGSYYVQVLREGFLPVEKVLFVASKEVTEWEIDLTQTAVRVQINLKNNVQGAVIFVDDEAKGTAPGDVYLQPGLYKLSIKKDNKNSYDLFEKVLEISPDSAEVRILAKLEPFKKPFLKKFFRNFYTGMVFYITASAVTAALLMITFPDLFN